MDPSVLPADGGNRTGQTPGSPIDVSSNLSTATVVAEVNQSSVTQSTYVIQPQITSGAGDASLSADGERLPRS